MWIGACAKDTTKLRILAPRLATLLNWLANVNFLLNVIIVEG